MSLNGLEFAETQHISHHIVECTKEDIDRSLVRHTVDKILFLPNRMTPQQTDMLANHFGTRILTPSGIKSANQHGFSKNLSIIMMDLILTEKQNNRLNSQLTYTYHPNPMPNGVRYVLCPENHDFKRLALTLETGKSYNLIGETPGPSRAFFEAVNASNCFVHVCQFDGEVSGDSERQAHYQNRCFSLRNTTEETWSEAMSYWAAGGNVNVCSNGSHNCCVSSDSAFAFDSLYGFDIDKLIDTFTGKSLVYLDASLFLPASLLHIDRLQEKQAKFANGTGKIYYNENSGKPTVTYVYDSNRKCYTHDLRWLRTLLKCSPIHCSSELTICPEIKYNLFDCVWIRFTATLRAPIYTYVAPHSEFAIVPSMEDLLRIASFEFTAVSRLPPGHGWAKTVHLIPIAAVLEALTFLRCCSSNFFSYESVAVYIRAVSSNSSFNGIKLIEGAKLDKDAVAPFIICLICDTWNETSSARTLVTEFAKISKQVHNMCWIERQFSNFLDFCRQATTIFGDLFANNTVNFTERSRIRIRGKWVHIPTVSPQIEEYRFKHERIDKGATPNSYDHRFPHTVGYNKETMHGPTALAVANVVATLTPIGLRCVVDAYSGHGMLSIALRQVSRSLAADGGAFEVHSFESLRDIAEPCKASLLNAGYPVDGNHHQGAFLNEILTQTGWINLPTDLRRSSEAGYELLRINRFKSQESEPAARTQQKIAIVIDAPWPEFTPQRARDICRIFTNSYLFFVVSNNSAAAVELREFEHTGSNGKSFWRQCIKYSISGEMVVVAYPPAHVYLRYTPITFSTILRNQTPRRAADLQRGSIAFAVKFPPKEIRFGVFDSKPDNLSNHERMTIYSQVNPRIANRKISPFGATSLMLKSEAVRDAEKFRMLGVVADGSCLFRAYCWAFCQDRNAGYQDDPLGSPMRFGSDVDTKDLLNLFRIFILHTVNLAAHVCHASETKETCAHCHVDKANLSLLAARKSNTIDLLTALQVLTMQDLTNFQAMRNLVQDVRNLTMQDVDFAVGTEKLQAFNQLIDGFIENARRIIFKLYEINSFGIRRHSVGMIGTDNSYPIHLAIYRGHVTILVPDQDGLTLEEVRSYIIDPENAAQPPLDPEEEVIEHQSNADGDSQNGMTVRDDDSSDPDDDDDDQPPSSSDEGSGCDDVSQHGSETELDNSDSDGSESCNGMQRLINQDIRRLREKAARRLDNSQKKRRIMPDHIADDLDFGFNELFNEYHDVEIDVNQAAVSLKLKPEVELKQPIKWVSGPPEIKDLPLERISNYQVNQYAAFDSVSRPKQREPGTEFQMDGTPYPDLITISEAAFKELLNLSSIGMSYTFVRWLSVFYEWAKINKGEAATYDDVNNLMKALQNRGLKTEDESPVVFHPDTPVPLLATILKAFLALVPPGTDTLNLGLEPITTSLVWHSGVPASGKTLKTVDSIIFYATSRQHVFHNVFICVPTKTAAEEFGSRLRKRREDLQAPKLHCKIHINTPEAHFALVLGLESKYSVHRLAKHNALERAFQVVDEAFRLAPGFLACLLTCGFPLSIINGDPMQIGYEPIGMELLESKREMYQHTFPGLNQPDVSSEDLFGFLEARTWEINKIQYNQTWLSDYTVRYLANLKYPHGHPKAGVTPYKDMKSLSKVQGFMRVYHVPANINKMADIGHIPSDTRRLLREHLIKSDETLVNDQVIVFFNHNKKILNELLQPCPDFENPEICYTATVSQGVRLKNPAIIIDVETAVKEYRMKRWIVSHFAQYIVAITRSIAGNNVYLFGAKDSVREFCSITNLNPFELIKFKEVAIGGGDSDDDCEHIGLSGNLFMGNTKETTKYTLSSRVVTSTYDPNSIKANSMKIQATTEDVGSKIEHGLHIDSAFVSQTNPIFFPSAAPFPDNKREGRGMRPDVIEQYTDNSMVLAPFDETGGRQNNPLIFLRCNHRTLSKISCSLFERNSWVTDLIDLPLETPDGFDDEDLYKSLSNIALWCDKMHSLVLANHSESADFDNPRRLSSYPTHVPRATLRFHRLEDAELKMVNLHTYLRITGPCLGFHTYSDDPAALLDSMNKRYRQALRNFPIMSTSVSSAVNFAFSMVERAVKLFTTVYDRRKITAKTNYLTGFLNKILPGISNKNTTLNDLAESLRRGYGKVPGNYVYNLVLNGCEGQCDYEQVFDETLDYFDSREESVRENLYEGMFAQSMHNPRPLFFEDFTNQERAVWDAIQRLKDKPTAPRPADYSLDSFNHIVYGAKRKYVGPVKVDSFAEFDVVFSLVYQTAPGENFNNMRSFLKKQFKPLIASGDCEMNPKAGQPINGWHPTLVYFFGITFRTMKYAQYRVFRPNVSWPVGSSIEDMDRFCQMHLANVDLCATRVRCTDKSQFDASHSQLTVLMQVSWWLSLGAPNWFGAILYICYAHSKITTPFMHMPGMPFAQNSGGVPTLEGNTIVNMILAAADFELKPKDLVAAWFQGDDDAIIIRGSFKAPVYDSRIIGFIMDCPNPAIRHIKEYVMSNRTVSGSCRMSGHIYPGSTISGFITKDETGLIPTFCGKYLTKDGVYPEPIRLALKLTGKRFNISERKTLSELLSEIAAFQLGMQENIKPWLVKGGLNTSTARAVLKAEADSYRVPIELVQDVFDVYRNLAFARPQEFIMNLQKNTTFITRGGQF